MKKMYSLCLMAMMTIAAMAQFSERVYLCGPAGPDWATKTWPMYTNLDANGMPDGTYEWVGDLKDGQIKFLYGTDWEPAYVATVDGEALTEGAHTMTTRLTGEDPDNKWVATAGRYKLELNAATMTLTVSNGTDIDTKNGDNQMFLYMVGDGCTTGWSLDDAKFMTAAKENVYEGDFTLTTRGEMKFLCQRDWSSHYGPAVNGEALTGAGTYTLVRHEEGDYKYAVSLSEGATFHFVLNLAEGTMTVSNASALQNTSDVKVTKLMMNGQVVILKNGERYNLMGVKL